MGRAMRRARGRDDRMIRRMLTAASTLALIISAMVPAATAAAGHARAQPYDGELVSATSPFPDVLITLPFGLGEVDLSALGVSQAELASVGPAAAAAPETSEGPNTRIVDDDGNDCPNAPYQSIQQAVDDSNAGDRIKVCPGLYEEQITIPADKGGLSLFSQKRLQAVIKAPQTMAEPGDIILVDGAQDVGIRQFVITGPLPDHLFCSLEIRTGVRVRGGGSATIYGNHITEIRSQDVTLRGCQNGIAVAAGRRFQGQTGRIELSQNLIDKYQKGGVYVDNTGSYGQIDHNEIVGTVTADNAPNGVQISRGAGARLNHNKVSFNQYTLPAFAGTGVLIYQAGDDLVRVDHNAVFKNDDGISLYTTSSQTIDHNNSYQQTRYDGIFMADDTSNNQIAENKAYQNFEHDCHDDSAGTATAGTANFWVHDQGRTQNRAGLCKNAETI
jgi:parallel beta-helix repeat protein